MRIVRNGKKGAKGAQRNELVNEIGLKANKPKGKDVVIGPGKPKGFSKSPREFKK